MISLRHHMERHAELNLSAALNAYRSALTAVGNHAAPVCPQLGDDLQRDLGRVAGNLSDDVSPELLRNSEVEVDNHLRQWGAQAGEYLRKKTDDVKELMLVVAQTAQALGERDHRYHREFQEFGNRLRAAAGLSDLNQIRQTLVRSANELKTCVDAMAAHSQESLSRLQAQVDAYQEKLKEAEQLVTADTLTGLYNRRGLEARIAESVRSAQPFSIMLLDLNGFKGINDRYGHPAGDSILRQLGSELKSHVQLPDVAGRWGGDEFLVVCAGSAAQASQLATRLRDWVFGQYVLDAGGKTIKIDVSAAIGIAEWNPPETIESVVGRADAAMYKNKRERK